MIDLVVSTLVLCGFAWFTMWLINKYMGEVKNVTVYVVLCNGRVSSEGYKTLKKAQLFCKKRGAVSKQNGNGWIYQDELNCLFYQIIDITVV